MIRIIMDTTTTTMEMVVIMGTEVRPGGVGTGTITRMGAMRIGETTVVQIGRQGKVEVVAEVADNCYAEDSLAGVFIEFELVS
jgi:hypothetical protein